MSYGLIWQGTGEWSDSAGAVRGASRRPTRGMFGPMKPSTNAAAQPQEQVEVSLAVTDDAWPRASARGNAAIARRTADPPCAVLIDDAAQAESVDRLRRELNQ